MRVLTFVWLLWCTSGAVCAQAFAPFLINETSVQWQMGVTLAPLPGGGFVATWMSREMFPPGPPDVFARRFDAGGVALGGEFPVNASGGGHWGPEVASDSLGAFAIVWRVDDAPLRIGLYGRRYDAAGAAIGGEVELVSDFSGHHDLAMGPSGEAVLVWTVEGDTTRVWARDLDAMLVPGPAVVVAEYPEQFLPLVSAARLPSGVYAVAWTSPVGGSDRDVRARVYDATGAPTTPELAVTGSPGLNADPDIALNAAGEITVVWWSAEEYLSPSSIRMRRFSAAGAPISGEVTIDDGLGNSSVPALDIDGAGNLAVAWSVQYGNTSSSNAWQVRGRRFGPDGTPAGPSLLVSEFHPDASGNGSLYPDVCLRDDGAIVAAWTEEGFDDGDVYGNLVPVVASSAARTLARGLVTNHPNPFNPSTTIDFVVTAAGHTTLVIYDVVGRRIRTLVDAQYTPGVFNVVWDGCDDAGRSVASGVYLCHLDVPGADATEKMVVLK